MVLMLTMAAFAMLFVPMSQTTTLCSSCHLLPFVRFVVVMRKDVGVWCRSMVQWFRQAFLPYCTIPPVHSKKSRWGNFRVSQHQLPLTVNDDGGCFYQYTITALGFTCFLLDASQEELLRNALYPERYVPAATTIPRNRGYST